ncbi:DUF3987 domain-containing protein [Flavobacterium psychrophilum]|nr:DUF3987 domain-containing protein [Flavobacterium psychrophilum]EKT4517230.1 DUF3987 domain-containing protein [Flavobacterium psychrophilum]
MESNTNHRPQKSLLIPQSKDTKTIGLKGLDTAIDSAMNSIPVSSENQFPIEVFPKLFKDLVIDLNKSLNFPIDYTGTAVLTAMATVIGTSVKIRVKNNWFEYASIYSCIIGNAGANKTHPVNTIFAPIKDLDKANHDDYASRLMDWDKWNKLPKAEKEGTTEPPFPILTKSILTNFTPEVLYKRLDENLRGCTVLSDEMATFFDGMNNYSKGDQIGVYLSFWSNQSTTIDRIGNPMPLFIQNPYLSIIGGLQPRVLANSFPVQKLNNGFFQRFLFAFPDTTFKSPINDNELNNQIFDRYEDFIKNYYNNSNVVEENGHINSRILSWTAEAKAFFYNWQKENCNLVNEYNNSIKGEIASKFDNHFVRLALLLQIMKDPKSDLIELDAVKGAEKLCVYFMNCSFKVLAVIQDPKEYLGTLVGDKQKFYKQLKEEFTTAEAIAVGLNFDIQDRRVKEFLKDTVLFKRIRHGYYEKTIKEFVTAKL